MSIINPYKQLAGNGSQKLSVLYIQQAYFYRIQIKSVSSMYKLNVRLKKPIILSLHSLPVLKYIVDHTEALNSILQMQTIYEIKICVPGYGIFNQKYQLQRISSLFQILSSYCQHISLSAKKVSLEFPGWRTFTNEIISNIFKFIKKCEGLEEFSFNINHAMNLGANKAYSEDQQYSQQAESQTFYGKYFFQVQQFNYLMACIIKNLPQDTINKIQLRFGAWEVVSNRILQMLIESIKKIYDAMKNIKIMKLDINGWGTGQYNSTQNEIKYQTVQKLFRTIEEFDGESSELLEIDMRNWPSKYKINKFKERFQYLSGGGKKKDEGMMSSMGAWTMTGTNFFNSQMKGKLMGRMKIQIKD